MSSVELLSNSTLMVFEELKSEFDSEVNLLVEEHPKNVKTEIIRNNLSLGILNDEEKI